MDFSLISKAFPRGMGALVLGLLMAGPVQADGASSYGTPGLIDMPTARAAADGTLSFSGAYLSGHFRNQIHFQITPRLSGVFRYSRLNKYDEDLFDRSFDLHYVLGEGGDGWPALAIGLRDFGGTGVFGSEYLVATRQFGDRLSVSGGIGWGRLGSYHGFSNPLGAISEGAKVRPGNGGIAGTGQVSTDQFFRGDAAFFAGLDYQLNERTRLIVEYSSDAYTRETRTMRFEHRTPFNFGLDYRLGDKLSLGVFSVAGAQIGARLNYVIDPRAPQFPGGIETGVEPLRPQASLASLGWEIDDDAGARDRLREALARQNLRLESYRRTGDRAAVVIENRHFPAAAQALGRTARAMANALPPGISTFEITLSAEGLALSRTTLRRSDLSELEHAWDGSWQSLVRAKVDDPVRSGPPDPGLYPRMSWALTPYLAMSFFDPDDPLRYGLGAQLAGRYSPRPGLSFSAALRQPLAGTLSETTRRSNSILPHVRSDHALYDKSDSLKLSSLIADYRFRPGRDLYARLAAGYLEQMYAGVASELLWAPVSGPLALGIELDYVAQRDFDGAFGLTDYRVATGHASVYYDLGGGYLGQVDAGRYLAGDWGATFSLDREFDNGFRVGAFFTLTDVSFDDFGEGSFDKGIRFTFPIDWITGRPGKQRFSQTIRPILRDGGARLELPGRLFETVRGGQLNELEDRWGKFWR